MRSILKSTLNRTVAIAAIAGLAVTAIGATGAEARPWHEWHGGYHQGWNHPNWNHAHWYGGRYWGGAPRYYTAPPVVYPQPYYGPPGINFNIPLG